MASQLETKWLLLLDMKRKWVLMPIYGVIVLLIPISFACKPLTPDTNDDKQVNTLTNVAIYEQNNGRQPVQAKLFAKIALGYELIGQEHKASKLLIPAIQTSEKNQSLYIKSGLLEELGIIYIKMGEYDKALQTAKSLQIYESSEKNIPLKRIAVKMAEAVQYNKALTIASLVSVNGVSSSYEPIVVSRSTTEANIAIFYARAGQKQKAAQVLAQAFEKADSKAEKAFIAVSYAQVGQKAKALQILSDASQNALTTHDKTAIAVSYAQLGEKAIAEKLLAEAFEQLNQQKKRDDYSLANIAISYASIGKFGQAFATAKLIKNYASPEDYKNALYVTPDGLISGAMSTDVFAEIAKKSAAEGKFEQALEIAKYIKWTGNKAEAISKIAVEYAKVGKYEQAFNIIKDLTENGGIHRDEALSKIAVQHGIKRQYKEAFQLIQKVRSENYKTEALSRIVEQARLKEPANVAIQVLSQAMETAQTLNRHEKVDALTMLAINYIKLGQKDKAETLLAQSLRIAENINQ
ncbi:hypothetical protein DSM106972_037090 [Dulcicalothrix desertica PCC 7102]|uniref:Uncharacterized protein n=1 Tax=Dulcicalothrix desertica PCC 7102 TaxID=232991 RepID=A0A3S1CKW6_9CYAN|nr:tetratricopeptide repeat protein [Dulcicalothrix desertica]RUT05702.1 hypothetical protein DSM106972_037090 [Dulcicalothrix desertica PCC 7102]TWH39633.1 hypothetical protein CAL7102_08882 [Dulcicalothrix desertica PCC 7102]